MVSGSINDRSLDYQPTSTDDDNDTILSRKKIVPKCFIQKVQYDKIIF